MKLRKIETGIAVMDMTPMIDVVFQLVMFVMIAINFENTNANERVNLPKNSLAKPPLVRSEYELVLNVSYQRDLSGARVKTIPEVFYNERYVEIRQIEPELEQEKRVIERLHGRQAIKDVTVVIRADSEIPTGQVQELIKKCQDAGFSRFSLRAITEEI
jgi:biopolymer transport protein ExbD